MAVNLMKFLNLNMFKYSFIKYCTFTVIYVGDKSFSVDIVSVLSYFKLLMFRFENAFSIMQ